MDRHHRQDDKNPDPSFWIKVLVGALIRFAVNVAWKLINSRS